MWVGTISTCTVNSFETAQDHENIKERGIFLPAHIYYVSYLSTVYYIDVDRLNR